MGDRILAWQPMAAPWAGPVHHWVPGPIVVELRGRLRGVGQDRTCTQNVLTTQGSLMSAVDRAEVTQPAAEVARSCSRSIPLLRWPWPTASLPS